MKIHLVSGFLGSGKTTAIANACGLLRQDGVRAGVITNDQGNYLVDSELMASRGIFSGQVSGGCFCCNYDQLDALIQEIKASGGPDVLFAEAVGSCTDLVATVLKPMLNLRSNELDQMTFSTFADARLLLMHLEGHRLPFSADTGYIWLKQLEEAGLVVINKIDLLNPADISNIEEKLRLRYPQKQFLFQNSLDNHSLAGWLAKLAAMDAVFLPSLEIDYARYGNGEAELAWLDEQIVMETADGSATERSFELVENFVARLEKLPAAIGHLKVMLNANNRQRKISFTTLSAENFDREELASFLGPASRMRLTLNARVQTSPEMLRAVLVNELARQRKQDGVSIFEENVEFFKPRFPTPVHRMIS